MIERKPFALRSVHFRVLEVIEKYVAENGFAPTIDELVAMTRIKSKSHMSYLLNDLIFFGCISKRKNIARSIVQKAFVDKNNPGRLLGADGQAFNYDPWGSL